jgi:predicted RNA-binding Zn-ribbon protein involved in translation (DUF1610 family)
MSKTNLIANTDKKSKHRCDNCDWVGPESGLGDIEDLEQRIEPGGTVPSGECPKCGALAYPETEPVYYLLHVWGDVEPEILGPFKTEEERDAKAKALRERESDDPSGLYPLTIKDATPEVWAYSGGFFEEEEE